MSLNSDNPVYAQAAVSYGAAVARSGVAVVTTKAMRYGLVFLVQAFLMNLLAPDEFGLMKYVTIILGVVNLITVAGLNTAIIQKKELPDSERGPLFILNLLLCLMLAGAVCAAAPLAARFFGEPELVPLIRAGSLVVLAGGISTVHRSVLQREFRYGALSVIEAVSAAVSSAVSIVLAFRGYGAWALCWSLIAFHTVSSALCLIIGQRLRNTLHDGAGAVGNNRISASPASRAGPSLCAGAVAALPLFWFGAGWTLLRFLDYLNNNLGSLLIGRFFGTGVLGAFTVAFELVTIPQLGFGLVLVPVALSAFSRMQDDDERMRAAYLKIVFLTSMVSMVYCVIVGLCASDLIRAVTAFKPGAVWDGAAFFISRLAPLGLIYSWSCCSGVLWTAKRRIALQLCWAAAMTLTSAAAVIIGANYGYSGVCAALLVRAIVTFPVLLTVMDKTAGVTSGKYLSALAPSLVCGAAGAAVCVGSMYIMTEIVPAHHIIRLAVCGSLSAAAFLLTAVLLYGKRLAELRDYFRK